MNTEPQSRIILVDMDGVIADQHQGFLHILETRHPEVFATYRGSDTEYEFENNFPVEHHELIKSLRNQEGFFRDLPPIEGAKEALEDMITSGHEVYICTSPIWEYRYCVPEKFAWVEQYLGREWVMRILTARDKTVVRGNLLIDDNLVVTGAHTPTWEHIIFDRSYNRDAPDKRRIDWNNWKTIIG